MQFCQAHWDRLRVAIAARGLDDLVHKSGEAIAEAMTREIEGTDTPKDFDPLMSAHWAIVNNASRMMDRMGANPLYLLDGGPEDPIDAELLARAVARGRTVPPSPTWPRCPLCYLNLAHKLTCSDSKCEIDLERGVDWMLDRAADDALATARSLGLVPSVQ